MFCCNIGACAITEQQKNTLLQYAYLQAYFINEHQLTYQQHHKVLMELANNPPMLSDTLNYLKNQGLQQHNIDVQSIKNIINYLEHPYIPNTVSDLSDLMPFVEKERYTSLNNDIAIIQLLARVKSALQSRSSMSLNIVGWDIIYGGIDYSIEKYGLAVLTMYTLQDCYFYHTHILEPPDSGMNDDYCLYPEDKGIPKKKKYACQYIGCNKSYMVDASLKIHQAHKHKVNNGVITKFSCEDVGCGKTYQCKASLKAHQAHEHGVDNGVITKFSCEYEGCGKAYKYKAALKQHMMDKHNT